MQPGSSALSAICFRYEVPQPPLDVTRGANEEILQFDFAKTPVTAAAQAVPTRQFTQGAFNRIALVHPVLECFGPLFLAPLLQKIMVQSPQSACDTLGRRERNALAAGSVGSRFSAT